MHVGSLTFVGNVVGRRLGNAAAARARTRISLRDRHRHACASLSLSRLNGPLSADDVASALLPGRPREYGEKEGWRGRGVVRASGEGLEREREGESRM